MPMECMLVRCMPARCMPKRCAMHAHGIDAHDSIQLTMHAATTATATTTTTTAATTAATATATATATTTCTHSKRSLGQTICSLKPLTLIPQMGLLQRQETASRPVKGGSRSAVNSLFASQLEADSSRDRGLSLSGFTTLILRLAALPLGITPAQIFAGPAPTPLAVAVEEAEPNADEQIEQDVDGEIEGDGDDGEVGDGRVDVGGGGGDDISGGNSGQPDVSVVDSSREAAGGGGEGGGADGGGGSGGGSSSDAPAAGEGSALLEGALLSLLSTTILSCPMPDAQPEPTSPPPPPPWGPADAAWSALLRKVTSTRFEPMRFGPTISPLPCCLSCPKLSHHY